ncbi:MAG: OmpA family protein [Verrucomicrobiaceae bacterium]|nr:OmpA family protein [Verrucomicrobiaceae bacterium]
MLLCSCASVQWPVSPGNQVVYALGSRADFVSPLKSRMTPVCPALEFDKGQINAGPRHVEVLRRLVDERPRGAKSHYVVAAYCQPDLPPEYARVLSEKRAHSVRQRLIELGVDPGEIQTAGFGNDFALTGPANDVVVIYDSRP